MSRHATELPRQSSRYILARIGQIDVAFPVDIVAEIASLDQSAILHLLFYSPRVLGVAHYRGNLMPLCTLTQQHAVRDNSGKGTLTAIRLNDHAGDRAGAGIAVNKILGQVTASQLTPSDRSSSSENATQPYIFSLDDLPDEIWQPQRSPTDRTVVRADSAQSNPAEHPSDAAPNDSISLERSPSVSMSPP